MTNPSVKADVGSLASSATKGAEQAVTQAVTQKARPRRRGWCQQAEQQAAGIRQQAQTLADKVKLEGYQQADSLTAKAGDNPLLQAAAKPAADQLKKETDNKAAGIVGEANRRADSLIAAAKRQATRREGRNRRSTWSATHFANSGPA